MWSCQNCHALAREATWYKEVHVHPFSSEHSREPFPLEELGDTTSSQIGTEETRTETYRRLRERGAHRGLGRGLRGRRSGRLAASAEREGRLLGGGRGGGGGLLGALSHRLELHRDRHDQRGA